MNRFASLEPFAVGPVMTPKKSPANGEACTVTRRRRRTGLFCGFWFEAETGRRLRRARRDELRMAYALWIRHRDVREGRA